MRKVWLIGSVLVLLVGAGISIAWLETSDAQLTVGSPPALAQTEALTDPSSLNQAIADSGQAALKGAIAEVGPAVVRIDVTGTTTVSSSFLDLFNDPFFRRFFDDPFDSEKRQRTTKSLGSGVVILFEDEKLVLTNAHVIQNADTITVSNVDGNSWDATVVGTDEVVDVAVLRLDGDTTGLATAELGDSSTVEIGDWAIAVGNPLGLSYTVTLGIISGVNRDIAKPSGVGTFYNLIQTDAAINPGNSGGPLVNAFGEVIGLNTVIARGTSSGVSIEGINFAVAINGIRDILPQLIRTGEVKRGWLGVQHTEINSETAKTYGIDPNLSGTLVVRVYPGDPADIAGIEVGDIIIRVGDVPIETTDDLNREIGLLGVGTEVEITVLRDGETRTMTPVLGERPSEEALATYQGSAAPEGSEVGEFGITVGPITAIVAQHLGLNSTDGVVIMKVTAGSRAERAGLSTGDVILEVDHQPVITVEEWNEAVAGVDEGESITLTVLRNGRLSFVTI